MHSCEESRAQGARAGGSASSVVAAPAGARMRPSVAFLDVPPRRRSRHRQRLPAATHPMAAPQHAWHAQHTQHHTPSVRPMIPGCTIKGMSGPSFADASVSYTYSRPSLAAVASQPSRSGCQACSGRGSGEGEGWAARRWPHPRANGSAAVSAGTAGALACPSRPRCSRCAACRSPTGDTGSGAGSNSARSDRDDALAEEAVRCNGAPGR